MFKVDKNFLIMIFALCIGATLRIYASFIGYNADMQSWFTAAEIVNRHSQVTVYQGTPYYNYGPLWFEILGIISQIKTFSFLNNFDNLRLNIAVLLTIVDVFIALFLYLKIGVKSSILFILNPVSIIITGYHSQFDNLAILIGLLSVNEMDKKNIGMGLVLLGISISLKHILFIFPLWLALRATSPKEFIRCIFVPYLIFAIGFTFYIRIDNFSNYIVGNELYSIYKNVFQYRSFTNGVWWSLLLPPKNLMKSSFHIFLASMVIFGYIFRKRNLLEGFCLYLVTLVVFSSAIANQYLTIPSLTIAIYTNFFYICYAIYGALYLSVDYSGLHISEIIKTLNWGGSKGLEISVYFLTLGLVWQAFKKPKKTDG